MKASWLDKLVPVVGAWLLGFVYRTNRKVYEIAEPLPEEPVILAVWHGRLAMPSLFYAFRLRETPNLKILISQSKDGEYIAKTMERFGLGAVRGSRSKGAARVLLQAIRAMEEEGCDVAITPDGPRGPNREVAGGIVTIAQKTGRKIVPLGFTASRAWEFSSWDRFMLPKPFGTLTLRAGAPIGVGGLEMDEAREKIKAALDAASRE